MSLNRILKIFSQNHELLPFGGFTLIMLVLLIKARGSFIVWLQQDSLAQMLALAGLLGLYYVFNFVQRAIYDARRDPLLPWCWIAMLTMVIFFRGGFGLA